MPISPGINASEPDCNLMLYSTNDNPYKKTYRIFVNRSEYTAML